MAVALAPLAALAGAFLKALPADPCAKVLVVLVDGERPVVRAVLAVQLGHLCGLFNNYNLKLERAFYLFFSFGV